MRRMTALAALLALAGAAQPVGLLDDEPVVVVGHGTMTFINHYIGWVCPGFDTRIEVVGKGTATLTVQATDSTPCTLQAQYYTVNPYVIEGDWEHGWTGDAVGADPPVVWPLWDVVIGPATDPSNVWFWSYYVDANGRDYTFYGHFAIEAAV